MHLRPNPPFEAIEEGEDELDKIVSQYWGLSLPDLAELRALVDERESSVGKQDDDITSRMFEIATSSEEQ
jgi:hypothetical protein